MERLTNSGTKEAKSNVTIKEAIDKLAEYEDLEEQGLLIRLPCKVGDVLYVIYDNEINECVVNEMIYRAYRIPRIEIYFENRSGFESCLFNGELNEGVFLTKAEADEALQRNTGHKNGGKKKWTD